MGEICDQPNDNDILYALRHLPSSLTALFDNMLGRVYHRKGSSIAIKMLQFCGVTRRPLSCDEFQELLSVAPEQTYLDRRGMPNDMNSVLSDCCGLAFVDEEENTIHYVHHSFRDYLFTGDSPKRDQFVRADLEMNLGILCLTYLNFNDFERQLDKIPKISNAAIEPLNIGITSLHHSSPGGVQFAQKFIAHKRHTKRPDVTHIGRMLRIAPISSSLVSELNQHAYAFLRYAQVHWISHLNQLQNTTQPKTWKLFCRYVHSVDQTLAERPWEATELIERSVDVKMLRHQLAIQWACDNRHAALFLSLVQSSRWPHRNSIEMLIECVVRDLSQFLTIILINTHNTTEILSDALIFAAARGRLNITELLLGAGAQAHARFKAFHLNEENIIGEMNAGDGHFVKFGSTALENAIYYKHYAISRMLEAANKESEEYRLAGWTALHQAAEAGQMKEVAILIHRGADVNRELSSSQSLGQTALHRAARAGQVEVVNLLLRKNAYIDKVSYAVDGYSQWTALCFAAAYGHLDVVDALLAAGANVDLAIRRPMRAEVMQRLREVKEEPSSERS